MGSTEEGTLRRTAESREKKGNRRAFAQGRPVQERRSTRAAAGNELKLTKGTKQKKQQEKKKKKKKKNIIPRVRSTFHLGRLIGPKPRGPRENACCQKAVPLAEAVKGNNPSQGKMTIKTKEHNRLQQAKKESGREKAKIEDSSRKKPFGELMNQKPEKKKKKTIITKRPRCRRRQNFYLKVSHFPILHPHL